MNKMYLTLLLSLPIVAVYAADDPLPLKGDSTTVEESSVGAIADNHKGLERPDSTQLKKGDKQPLSSNKTQVQATDENISIDGDFGILLPVEPD